MAKKNKYKPKGFESDGRSNDTSSNIYESMLQSEKFKDLALRQRMLYVYMKAQYYGKRKPGKDFPEIESLQKDEMFYFTLNMAEEYKIYSKSNSAQFYKDIKVLVEHGFIKKVVSGRNTKSKNIYEFAGDWK